MSNPLWRRKIDYTVRECGLTGLLLMSGGDSQLVLVEGGTYVLTARVGWISMVESSRVLIASYRIVPCSSQGSQKVPRTDATTYRLDREAKERCGRRR